MDLSEWIALYPGTFDPVTLGHLDIIKRSSSLFDKVIVGILENKDKKTFFSVEQRKNMLKGSFKELKLQKNIEVASYSGLLVDFAKAKRVHVIIRGLRAVSDFDYEFQLEVANKHLRPEIETLFLMTDQKYFYLSSSMVKEIAMHGGDVGQFVTKSAEKQLRGAFP